MQLDLLHEVSLVRRLPDEDGEVGFGRRAELGDFGRPRLSDVLRVRRALALEDRAVCERAERGVEDAVRRVQAAEVLRDEAEERERIADGFLECCRVRAGDGASQPRADRFKRVRLDVARVRRKRDGGPVIYGMVDTELSGDRVFDHRRLAALGCLLLNVVQQIHVDGLLRRGRGEHALLAAFVEDGLHVARFAVGKHPRRVDTSALWRPLSKCAPLLTGRPARRYKREHAQLNGIATAPDRYARHDFDATALEAAILRAEHR